MEIYSRHSVGMHINKTGGGIMKKKRDYTVESACYKEAIKKANMAVLNSRANPGSIYVYDDLEQEYHQMTYLLGAIQNGMNPDALGDAIVYLILILLSMVVTLLAIAVIFRFPGGDVITPLISLADRNVLLDALLAIVAIVIYAIVAAVLAFGLGRLYEAKLARPAYEKQLRKIIKDLEDELSHYGN